MLTGPPSTLLPPDARAALIAAAQIKHPKHRQLAIQHAIEQAQRRHPQFFQPPKGVAP